VNKAHRQFIRELPCVGCGRMPPCDPATSGGAQTGHGLKPSDRFLVPLCNSATWESSTEWEKCVLE